MREGGKESERDGEKRKRLEVCKRAASHPFYRGHKFQQVVRWPH